MPLYFGRSLQANFIFTSPEFSFPMQTNLKKLIEELYWLNPSLREKEVQLEKLVVHMTNLKPEISVSDTFRKVLKNRLTSEIELQKTSKIKGGIKKFQILWYVLATGAMASFAVSFGFLSIIGITGPREIQSSLHKKVAITSQRAPTVPEAGTPSLEAMTKSIDTQIMPNATVTTRTVQNSNESTSKSIMKPQQDKTNASRKIALQPPVSHSPKTTTINRGPETILPIEQKNTTIAYVGMAMDKEAPTISPRSSSSDDTLSKNSFSDEPMMMGASPTSLMGNDTSNGISENGVTAMGTGEIRQALSFSGIVALAQKDANVHIEEKDRSFYILKTPHISYVSKESLSSRDTVELVKVYLFPLERIDGKEPIVKEISVSVE